MTGRTLRILAALGGVGAVGVAGAAFSGLDSTESPVITVYKAPSCGCCSKWIDHLRENGFEVVAHDVNDLTDIKINMGITGDLASCHTAVVDGYVIEGHVPADVVERLLRERPRVAGLSVPGMPMGSPGMEGNRVDPYNVIAFDLSGGRSVYERR